ncbi:MAG: carboxymuconolactone decarboxylase family protein [Pseudolabrys sp.]|jgi:alkylhydroperoxidase family enzyme|nr:carboxymuconolactone decarboxylase family protein [Pseudolabrys sp.]
MNFTVHTIESAPAAAKETLAGAKNGLGFVPNLFGVMSEAPALVKAYATLSGIFDETSLSVTERQVVLLTVSAENNCEYCVAAHSVISGMQKVPVDVVRAIRVGQPIADSKLEALRNFTAAVVNSRGWPKAAEMAAFLSVGYGQQQVLEVVLGVGMKTLSNYANHIAKIPLDQVFASAAWSKGA